MPIPSTNENLLVTFLVKPLVFIVKIPFLVVSTLGLILLSPIGQLCKPLLYLYLAVFFNLSQTELLVDGVKKSNQSTINSKRPNKGDIIFVNFSSPLDSLVLYISCRCSSAVFYTINEQGQLAKVGSPLNCFKFALQQTHQSSVSHSLKVTDHSRAIFVLVEGTTTNNRSVMRFPKKFDINKFVETNTNDHRFKALSIKIHPTDLACTPLPESWFTFVYNNVSNFRLDLRYRMKLFEMDRKTEITEQSIRESLSNYGKLKLLGEYLDIAKKKEFVQSYS
ncbi:hypothetical protein FOA43_003069 [Brettanomyces nanus]|uniref:Phospholipid/glycerol acyltransferase domain-containing protein n=1 Tax=Eeniella nana TaxID=13502 RepID=A0A875RQ07_EENNA|nr:uncharacterized protein FOA43_003069 [Brettanomyces nanus]QPG75710.1 hypothetical protein FOA43_003069 [Brettanomyces nanus]